MPSSFTSRVSQIRLTAGFRYLALGSSSAIFWNAYPWNSRDHQKTTAGNEESGEGTRFLGHDSLRSTFEVHLFEQANTTGLRLRSFFVGALSPTI
jgi:hypothetical protein